MHYKVCIQCITYNHSHYIEDAMNGFVAQEMGFPFVATIIDDASTDNAQKVISRYFEKNFDTREPSVAFQEETEYGKVLYARHNSNKNCFFAIVLLKENHYSKKKSKFPYLSRWRDNAEYIAPCEGDDYWTDSLKLQKQVCFLDDNPQYIICSHDFSRFFQEYLSFSNKTYYSSLFSDTASPESIEYSLDNYFDRWWTQPLTCVYRNGDYLKRIPYSSYPYFKDDIFYYYVLKEGKGMLFRDSMGVYRVHGGGVWSGASKIQHSQIAIYNAFNTYYVERDVRAFNRIDREELSLLKALLDKRSYWEVTKQLIGFRKKAPKNHYRSVRKGFRDYVLYKSKRKIRKILKY